MIAVSCPGNANPDTLLSKYLLPSDDAEDVVVVVVVEFVMCVDEYVLLRSFLPYPFMLGPCLGVGDDVASTAIGDDEFNDTCVVSDRCKSVSVAGSDVAPPMRPWRPKGGSRAAGRETTPDNEEEDEEETDDDASR